MDRIQSLIEKHFKEELKMVEEVNTLAMKIDKAGFKLYRIQLQNKKAVLNQN